MNPTEVSSLDYRSEATVSAELQDFESGHDLLRHKLDGWCVWPLLRFQVARRLQRLPLDAVNDNRPARRALLRRAVGDLVRLVRLPTASYIAFCHASSHAETRDGYIVDIYLDDVLLGLDAAQKIEVLDSASAVEDRRPHLVEPFITTLVPNVVAGRLARFISSDVRGLAELFSERIRGDLKLDEFTPEVVARHFAGFRWHRRLYVMLFRRMRPRCVLMVAADYNIAAAAKELRIPVVEFQHGFTHRHFPGTSWAAYARPYKGSMALPDRILLYGPYWLSELSANGFWDDELRVVGSVRVDAYRARSAESSTDAFTLVVTTQGTDTERLVRYFEEFLALAEGRTPLRLVFKMHPFYDRQVGAFRAAFGSHRNVRIVTASERPTTFELLKQADLHASIFSTCHYEALALGVPTVVVPLTGSECVLHLCEAGHAFLAPTPYVLLEVTERCRGLRVPSDVGRQYFSTDALGSIVRELRAVAANAGSTGERLR